MNIVLIVPTGIGCEIGGHAGDAQPVAKLIGSCCDILITHPNVVNASDLNEMPENTLYVEGSCLDRFLQGTVVLRRVNQNKILVAVNHADWQSINAINAARASIGCYAEMVVLKTPLKMTATMSLGCASGDVSGWEELVDQVQKLDFDVLGIVTVIDIAPETLMSYFTHGGVNPIGGVEAVASRLISGALGGIPVAHAPVDYTFPEFKEVVDPRKSVEIITDNFIHCIMKGLNKAPKIVNIKYKTSSDLEVRDVDALISPYGCWGPPHHECYNKDIPVIVVKENVSVLNDPYPTHYPRNLIFAENYLEAAGYLMAMKAGIHPSAVRRPLEQTKVL